MRNPAFHSVLLPLSVSAFSIVSGVAAAQAVLPNFTPSNVAVSAAYAPIMEPAAPLTLATALQLALAAVQFQHLFLHRFAGNQAVDIDSLGLADAVGAGRGLFFHGRIPPWLHMENIAGLGQIQTHAAGFQSHDQHGATGMRLKIRQDFLEIGRAHV